MPILRLLPFIIVTVFLSSCASRHRTTYRPHKSANKSKIIAQAEKLLDAPYRYGGDDPSGFDCSGYTYYVYRKAGILLPRKSSDQAKVGEKISQNQIKPGDLVFFGRGHIDHVGIVQRTSKNALYMLHSSTSKGIVVTEVYSSPYWARRFKFARRIIH